MFIGTLVVAYRLPGPDMLLLLQTGSREGRRPALATVAGLALSRAMHVTLASSGLATLLTTAPSVFEAVRLAGAAYLGWLGFRVVRGPSLLPGGCPEEGKPRRRSAHSVGGCSPTC
jgi:threonine/homoserine/homoserine lactone efflux protein